MGLRHNLKTGAKFGRNPEFFGFDSCRRALLLCYVVSNSPLLPSLNSCTN
ncbi:hypothetical protein JG688_00016458 [Phytophthora aleatoria]|uniref:Uncharacterized protein n=1 Tax=Phytophthora aleatoria TaxID=2496075 RepID=A0A8J5MCF6_9STRA|nr:hypothetical protein JG688_00016458 [Phytophthora aleatoria]